MSIVSNILYLPSSEVSQHNYCYRVDNGPKSSLLGIDCGVPEGSVLDPMFFHMFINDLGSSIN